MGKDRTVMRADMRLGLKDSGALWSDAELNRSIERAVSDLSRFLPRERAYEEVLSFTVTGESVTFPKDTSATYVVNAQTLNGKVAGNTFTIAAQPDAPRKLTLLITDANDSLTDWNIRIYGTDEDDLGVHEDFFFAYGKSQTGSQIFKRVKEVQLVSVSGTAAAEDVLSIGIGAYTDVWVRLAYKPVKWTSESATDAASNALVRNTDYLIDYIEGKVKAIASANIAAEEVCTFAYTKNQTHIDLSSLYDFIRVYRVEYPVGNIPQTFCPAELHGKFLSITGAGEYEGQQALQDGRQVRIQYDAVHFPPNDYAPGTVPEFLENTVIMGAEAYALLIYVLKQEHQSETDLASMRTALTAANTAHTALGTALTNVKKYLDNNSDADAVGILADITTDAAALRTAISAALDAANAYLDSVATDLTAADAARENYMGTTANYVDGGTEPDILAYLTSGDALLNKVNEGGEQQEVPDAYRRFADTTRSALIAAHEQDREFNVANARARTNAGLGYVQEAAQRISNIATYIEQASGYSTVASMFAREAEARLAEIAAYLQQARGYAESVQGELVLADRYRNEALERRNEVMSIWRDRKQYIGDYSMGSVRQLPRGND